MIEILIEIAKELNLAQLAAIGCMMWYGYSRLDRKIERVEERLTQKIERVEERLESRIDGLEAKVEKLSNRVDEIDRRLCRIEGSLATHGHCIFEHAPQKKAE